MSPEQPSKNSVRGLPKPEGPKPEGSKLNGSKLENSKREVSRREDSTREDSELEGSIPEDIRPEDAALSSGSLVPSVDSIDEAVRQAIHVLPPSLRSDSLEASLRTYLSTLLETNQNINLVSRRDTLTHVSRFTRECLFLASLLQEDAGRLARKRPLRLLDLGSGGGFPGIVLKLALPETEVQLVEGTRKKARFLAEVCGILDLRKMGVLWGRAEELSDPRFPIHKPEFRHHFDWVTGKGLGPIEKSLELAAPFLAPEGAHWTFKGKACQEELSAASGLFRQRGFAPLRVEPIPGDVHSYVVGIRRLPPK